MPSPATAVEVIAHRGASAHAPENTHAAYRLGIRHGADALEIDLRATAEGRLVALHDATLERTAGDPREIAELTLADLAQLPAAVRPMRLGGLLARYGHRTRLLLDLKDPTPAMVRRLVRTVGRSGLHDRVVVQSFEFDALRRMRRMDPALAVAPLRETLPDDLRRWMDRAVKMGAAAMGMWQGEIDAAMVTAAHERGLAIRAWTVNDPAEAERLTALGVDGLITDDPRLIRSVLEASGRVVAA